MPQRFFCLVAISGLVTPFQALIATMSKFAIGGQSLHEKHVILHCADIPYMYMYVVHVHVVHMCVCGTCIYMYM